MKHRIALKALLIASLMIAATACTKEDLVQPDAKAVVVQDPPCPFPLEDGDDTPDADRHVPTPPIIPDVQD